MASFGGAPFLVLPLLFSTACTIVSVGEGSRVSSVRPGVLTVAPAPGARLLAYRTQGIGIVPGRSGPTLGWSSEKAVLVYDASQCRIVLLDRPDAETSAFWKKLVEDHPDICIAGETQ